MRVGCAKVARGFLAYIFWPGFPGVLEMFEPQNNKKHQSKVNKPNYNMSAICFCCGRWNIFKILQRDAKSQGGQDRSG